MILKNTGNNCQSITNAMPRGINLFLLFIVVKQLSDVHLKTLLLYFNFSAILQYFKMH